MKNVLLIAVILSTVFLAGCTISTDDISDTINEYFAIDEIAGLFKNGKKEMLQQQINFENDLKCQERGDVLKDEYNNYHSIYYNTEANTCYVRYYNKENIIEESPIDKTYSTKTQQTQQTTQYNTQQTAQYNRQQSTQPQSSTNSKAMDMDCYLRLEKYQESMSKYRSCVEEGKVCLKPFKPSCY